MSLTSSAQAKTYTYVLYGPSSCPYTDTSTTFTDVDWRNPYIRFAYSNVAHSAGFRYIRTTGQAVSDYVTIPAHDTAYHQPANGYIAAGWNFWLRYYSLYGSCINGQWTYLDLQNHTMYLRA